VKCPLLSESRRSPLPAQFVEVEERVEVRVEVRTVAQAEAETVLAAQLALAPSDGLAKVRAAAGEVVLPTRRGDLDPGARLVADHRHSEPVGPLRLAVQALGEQEVSRRTGRSSEPLGGQTAILGSADWAELVCGSVAHEAQKSQRTRWDGLVERKDGGHGAVGPPARGQSKWTVGAEVPPPRRRPLPGAEDVATRLSQRLPRLTRGVKVAERLERRRSDRVECVTDPRRFAASGT